MSGRQQRVMVQPIVSLYNFKVSKATTSLSSSQNVIFKNLQTVRFLLIRAFGREKTG